MIKFTKSQQEVIDFLRSLPRVGYVGIQEWDHIYADGRVSSRVAVNAHVDATIKCDGCGAHNHDSMSIQYEWSNGTFRAAEVSAFFHPWERKKTGLSIREAEAQIRKLLEHWQDREVA